MARRTGSGRNGADLDTYIAGTISAEHARNRGLGNENETDFLIANTLRKGNGNVTGGVPFVNTSAIRRLTPTECERLQAFSDGWTAVQVRRHKKWCGFLDTSGAEKPCNCDPTIKDADDGPRYRALGNSMTTTVIGWIGERIERVNGVLAKLEEGAA